MPPSASIATARSVAVLLAAAFCGAGCAHPRETMTFAEAGIFDPDDALEPPEPPADDATLPRAIAPQASGPRAGVPVGGARPPPPGALDELPAAPPAARTPLQWPLDGAGVSSHFGMRRHPFDGDWRMHWGLDLAARRGRLVGSAAPGRVVRAGWARGYGLLVEIRHGGGLTTRYSHLARLLCGPGDAVESGQPLGLVGATGRATGPHLHFEVWHDGRARDPLALLAQGYEAGSMVAWRGVVPDGDHAHP